jgi:hypothetical protein
VKIGEALWGKEKHEANSMRGLLGAIDNLDEKRDELVLYRDGSCTNYRLPIDTLKRLVTEYEATEGDECVIKTKEITNEYVYKFGDTPEGFVGESPMFDGGNGLSPEPNFCYVRINDTLTKIFEGDRILTFADGTKQVERAKDRLNAGCRTR